MMTTLDPSNLKVTSCSLNSLKKFPEKWFPQKLNHRSWVQHFREDRMALRWQSNKWQFSKSRDSNVDAEFRSTVCRGSRLK